MMRKKYTLLMLCLVVLVPLSASGRQPVPDGCKLLVPASVNADAPFNVTVARSPAYPGQWVSPTVSVEVVVPVNDALLGPNSYSQSVTQTVDGPGGSNTATATFIIPAFPNLDLTGDVNVSAVVSEPVNRGKTLETYCTAVTAFM
jgi:hypothetical protein